MGALSLSLTFNTNPLLPPSVFRDGTERVEVDDKCTLSQLRTLIETQFGVPTNDQTLSLDQGLLMSKTPEAHDDLKPGRKNDGKQLKALKIEHGTIVYMVYSVERKVTTCTAASHNDTRGLIGGKMTLNAMIAAQTRIETQEAPNVESLSIDGHAANGFQAYVNGTLGFNQMRFGWMYGTCDESGEVRVHCVYEPEQEGAEDSFALVEDSDEDARADSIAESLGMTKVGMVFNITTTKERPDYTLSAFEVRTMAKYQSKYGDKFVTAVVMMLEDEDEGTPQVSFEPFQVSNQCVKLYDDGWFHDEPCENPGHTRLTKEVIVADKVSKDVTEVDNDRWLVPVKILDHEGPWRNKFPVENRLHPVQTVEDLRDAVSGSGQFYAKLADFHLLLFLSKHLDANDMAVVAVSVAERGEIPEGYQLIINSLAGVGF